MVPKGIYCAVNPISALTSELKDGLVPVAREKKKVAVVGGGVAGITAMTTLVDRGHDVTLYEKTDRLGGNVIGAAAPPFKIDCRDYLDWLLRQAEKCPARKIMNTEVTKEMLDAENYDAIVIAVGSEPIVPKLPGIDKPHVHWAPEAETGKVPVGNKIVIVGAGAVGLEAALDFADQGKDVTVIEMQEKEACFRNIHSSSGTSYREFRTIVDSGRFPSYYETALAEVTDDKVICVNQVTGEKLEIEADTGLLAVGMKPLTAKAEELRRSAPETSVRIVGDVKKLGTIGTAVNQAFQAALHI
jgi:NADPH-dependent 2,4-dienoyl-CoA reductase/sulfur reductase-like enzyme